MFEFEITYGCTTPFGLRVGADANPRDLGVFYVRTEGDETFADLELDFKAFGCVPSFEWQYWMEGDVTKTTVPAWIT